MLILPKGYINNKKWKTDFSGKSDAYIILSYIANKGHRIWVQQEKSQKNLHLTLGMTERRNTDSLPMTIALGRGGSAVQISVKPKLSSVV